MAIRLSDVTEVKCENGKILTGWLGKFKFFAGKRVHIVENSDNALRLRLYTARNYYALVANDDNDYLGCVASTRVPRPGEDWTRGNDLPDGRFCKETFNSVMGAIVFYEALEVAGDLERIVSTEEENENTGPAI